MSDASIGERTDLSAPATRADFEAIEAKLTHLEAKVEAQSIALRSAIERQRAENRGSAAKLEARFAAGIAEFKLGSAKLIDAVNRLNASRAAD